MEIAFQSPMLEENMEECKIVLTYGIILGLERLQWVDTERNQLLIYVLLSTVRS